MEIIYNNHSADAPSSNISQKLVVVSKCPIREGLHEVCVHGAGGDVVPYGVWGGEGCGGGGSTGAGANCDRSARSCKSLVLKSSCRGGGVHGVLRGVARGKGPGSPRSKRGGGREEGTLGQGRVKPCKSCRWGEGIHRGAWHRTS